MSGLVDYSSSSDEEAEGGERVIHATLTEPTPFLSKYNITSAPLPLLKVNNAIVAVSNSNNTFLKKRDEHVENAMAHVMLAPDVGPQNPFSGIGSSFSKSGGGNFQSDFIDDHIFNEAYHNYLNNGERNEPKPKKDKKKRKLDLSDVGENDGDNVDDGDGPWAAMKETERFVIPVKKSVDTTTVALSESSDPEVNTLPDNMYIVEPDLEAEKWEKVNERKQGSILPPRPSRGDVALEAKTSFHGVEEVDYQGRAWTSVSPEFRRYDEDVNHECFIPKKCVKKFLGHTKGVQQIELFPTTGHLLLSGSMDGKCKVWDVGREKNVLRTYYGHTEGVRSINMSNDGSQFLSSGYDRYVRLWDLETGQAIGTFSNRKMNYQVKFYPNDNHIFLCAASDNKIYQWDARTGNICQEYNYHLQSCNTITFIDNGQKFVSTSDDKKVLVWEYDIPVPIKYIAEPEMHSIPSVTVHPSQSFFCGQSMDNTIVTYRCDEKVNQVKKTFRGHNNAGYACQVNFSPNGKFVVSGDGLGKLHFWDWKTTKEFRKIQAHENGPCMGALWHPLIPSCVITCGWDGQIKMWS